MTEKQDSLLIEAISFDAASTRKKDGNGFIEIKGNPLTKVGVFPYLGAQIGAPDKGKIYQVYRPAEELDNEETIKSFRLLPFINNHEMLGEGFTPAEQKGVQGAVGDEVYFEYPYLKGNLKIYGENIKEAIDSGKVDLSAGYRCRYEKSPGEFEGQKYDYIQRSIRGNHIALVDEGRSGADVSVMDSLPIEIKETPMEETKPTMDEKLDEMKAMLIAIDEKLKKAKDEVAPAEEVKEEFVELDASLESCMKDCGLDVKDNATRKAFAEGVKYGEKVEKKEPKKLDSEHESEGAKKAMDEADIIKMIARRDAMAKALSKHIGSFACDEMTLTDVALYGAEKVGLDVDAETAVIAMDAWLHDRKPAEVVTAKPAVSSGDKFITDFYK